MTDGSTTPVTPSDDSSSSSEGGNDTGAGAGDSSTPSTAPTPVVDNQPKDMSEVKVKPAARPQTDVSSLQAILLRNNEVMSQASYLNADEQNQAAYLALISKISSEVNRPTITTEDVQALVKESEAVQAGLNGKATDITKAQATLEAYPKREEDMRYHNATADKRLAYDQAVRELTKLMAMDTSVLSQSLVDAAVAKVDKAKEALDGQVLSPAEQAKADAIRSFNDTYHYYEEMIGLLPTDSPYVVAAKQILKTQGASKLPYLQTYTAENVKASENQLKTWMDFYVNTVKSQMQNRLTLEERIRELENIRDTKVSLYQEINRLNDMIKAAKLLLEQKGQEYHYDQMAENLKRAGDEAVDTQLKADQMIKDYNQKRQEAIKELIDLQQPGKETYIKLYKDDGVLDNSVSLQSVVERTKLVAQTYPYLSNEYQGKPFNPEYLQYKTVEEYLQVGTPAYDKMMETLNRLSDSILKELDNGFGTNESLTNDISKQLRTLPTDADVEALRPLYALADAYSQRALENINRMRMAVGSTPYVIPPLSDKRKAMAIVHALAEYKAGKIKKFQGPENHLGSLALHLFPHTITAGRNENVYPSYNAPILSTHLTPEYLADMQTRIVLEEGIKFFDQYYTNINASGHFLSYIEQSLTHFYGVPMIMSITDKDSGFKSYDLSITEQVYTAADENYRAMLRHFNDWPQVDPERDLDRTDFSNLKKNNYVDNSDYERVIITPSQP